MKYKAILLDFYGTLVAEDDPLIRDILEAIAARSPVSSDIARIGRDWRFAELCATAHGGSFKTQRVLETESLSHLLDTYEVKLDAIALSQQLFAYWRAPEVFEDGAWFVQHNRLPVCIVSNIDTDDLAAAIVHAGWRFDHIVTSEICRSYKPRAEMFLLALAALRCSPSEVLHIGDSLGSDVQGARQLGIDTAWINRKDRPLPRDFNPPTFAASDLRELDRMMACA